MGSFLQSRRPQYDSYGYMSSGGGGRRSAYQLHKMEMTPSGPEDQKVWSPPDVAAPVYRVNCPSPGPEADLIKFIEQVKKLLQSNEKTIHVHTALLLMFMTHPPSAASPKESSKNLEARLKSWKGIFQKYQDNCDLGLTLKNMYFEVSYPVLDSLMSLLQPSGGNLLDFNNFIQCCAFVERLKVEIGSASSSASKKTAAKPGSSAGPKAAKPGSSVGPVAAKPGSSAGPAAAKPGSSVGPVAAKPGSSARQNTNASASSGNNKKKGGKG